MARTTRIFRYKWSAVFLGVTLLLALLPSPVAAAPSPPTGTSPGTTDPNNPTPVGSLTPTLNWSPSAGATGYFLNVRRMSDNQLIILERSVGNVNSYAMPSGDLAGGITYKWAVEAGDSTGAKSAQSTPIYFRTPSSASIPSPPTGASPGSTSPGSPTPVSTLTPTLTWTASAGATAYYLNMRRMSDNELFIDERPIGSGTSYTMPAGDLASGQTYKWAVEAGNSAGNSAQSTPIYFSTPSAVTVPNPPTGAAPGSNDPSNPTPVGGLTPTLTWNPSTGATAYFLNVRRMSDNVLFISERGVGSGTSYTMPAGDFAAGETYKWAVEAGTSAGNSAQSTSVYIRTPPAATIPNPPTSATPGNANPSGPELVATLTPTLSWTASTGATGYFLNVRRMSDNALFINERSVGSGTTYTMPSGDLSAGETYKWAVEAGNTAGRSAQSTPIYIRTPSGATIPSPPTEASPGNADSANPSPVSTTTPTLSWSASSGATAYFLNVRRVSDNVLFINERNVGSSTSYTFPGGDLAAGETYKWAVEAGNSAGNSPQSTPIYFRTPSPPSIPSPPTEPSPGTTDPNAPTLLGTLTPTLSWTASAGATGYFLNVRRMSDHALFINERGVGSGTSYTFPAGDLASGETYKWAVEAGNSAGRSPQSTPVYIRIQPSISTPAPPTGTAPGSLDPENPTQLGTLTPTLTWAPSSGATEYFLNVRRMSDNVLFISERSVGASTSYTIPSGDLANGQTYKWAVEAGNTAGRSAQSTPLYARTPPAPATVPALPAGLTPGIQAPEAATGTLGQQISSLSTTFSWVAPPGPVDRYGVYVSQSPYTEPPVVRDEALTTTSLEVTLACGTSYRWNVRAHNSNGWGDYAPNPDRMYFRTPDCQSNPVSTTAPSPTWTQGASWFIRYGSETVKATEVRRDDGNAPLAWVFQDAAGNYITDGAHIYALTRAAYVREVFYPEAMRLNEGYHSSPETDYFRGLESSLQVLRTESSEEAYRAFLDGTIEVLAGCVPGLVSGGPVGCVVTAGVSVTCGVIFDAALNSILEGQYAAMRLRGDSPGAIVSEYGKDTTQRWRERAIASGEKAMLEKGHFVSSVEHMDRLWYDYSESYAWGLASLHLGNGGPAQAGAEVLDKAFALADVTEALSLGPCSGALVETGAKSILVLTEIHEEWPTFLEAAKLQGQAKLGLELPILATAKAGIAALHSITGTYASIPEVPIGYLSTTTSAGAPTPFVIPQHLDNSKEVHPIIEEHRLTIEVKSSTHEGETLTFSIDRASAARILDRQLTVSAVDAQGRRETVQRTYDLEDVQNPLDDGLVKEFYVQGGDPYLLHVSFPHFSEWTLVFEGAGEPATSAQAPADPGAQAAPPSAPGESAPGFGASTALFAVAALAILARRRQRS